MVFWGIEVKSSKPYTHRLDGERGKLHLSQATLGTGSSTKKSILQCNVGDKRPVYLCSLVAEKFENCQLNLEFEEDDDVIFSVIGPRSIHLSGFFISGTQESHRDDYESDYGEDIAETESDEATDYDSEDEYDDDFIVDDMDMYPPSPVPKSGVVIEEILDDEKLADENGIAKRGKKKIRSSSSEDNGNSERQLILKSDNGSSILESEDEDGFPISSPQRNKADVPGIEGKAEQNKDLRTVDASKKAEKDDHVHVESLKRKVDVILQGGEQIRKAGKQLDSSLANPEVVPEAVEKKNKKKKSKEEKTSDAGTGSKSNTLSEASTTDMEQDEPVGKEHNEKDLDIDAHFMAEEKKGKTKKKKKKSKKQKSNADTDQSVPDKIGSTKDKDIEEETESKPFQVRSFPNGLVIEELAMGKPDGKRASPGKKVGVHYIGKLKRNGGIFDSNIGKAPFKFRLGVGQVIKGWDVGVNGMRVGDKRRITIPPGMGYGAKGAGQVVPPNAWLVFDVELVEVR